MGSERADGPKSSVVLVKQLIECALGLVLFQATCSDCGRPITTHQTPTQRDIDLCDECWPD